MAQTLQQMREAAGISAEELAEKSGLEAWEISRIEEIGLPLDTTQREGQAYLANRLLPALNKALGVIEISERDAPMEPNTGDILLRSYKLTEEQREALDELGADINLRICLAGWAWGFYLIPKYNLNFGPDADPEAEKYAAYMLAVSARASLDGKVVRWNEDSPEDVELKQWARKAIKQSPCQPEPLDYAIDMALLKAHDEDLLQELYDAREDLDLRVAVVDGSGGRRTVRFGEETPEEARATAEYAADEITNSLERATFLQETLAMLEEHATDRHQTVGDALRDAPGKWGKIVREQETVALSGRTPKPSKERYRTKPVNGKKAKKRHRRMK